jgi:uncharacterized protein YbjT (DUF2867 family)
MQLKQHIEEGTHVQRMLVTGGTGTLGSLVVARLRRDGSEVRILSRRSREPADDIDYVVGDLATGQGIDAALAGIDVVVHCAGSGKGDGDKARQLVHAALRVGQPRIVFISVVGADRVPIASRIDRVMFGYFEAKLQAERVIAESGLPWTTLRATQFFELVLLVAQQLARLPVVLVPGGFRFQPVDSGEVAERLVELALAQPSGLVADIAGPRVYGMADLLRSYLRARDMSRPILAVPLPGKAARAVRSGAILAPARAVGRRTWEEFLAARLIQPGAHQAPGAGDASQRPARSARA